MTLTLHRRGNLVQAVISSRAGELRRTPFYASARAAEAHGKRLLALLKR
jgi:hypothetical protein